MSTCIKDEANIVESKEKYPKLYSMREAFRKMTSDRTHYLSMSESIVIYTDLLKKSRFGDDTVQFGYILDLVVRLRWKIIHKGNIDYVADPQKKVAYRILHKDFLTIRHWNKNILNDPDLIQLAKGYELIGTTNYTINSRIKSVADILARSMYPVNSYTELDEEGQNSVIELAKEIHKVYVKY